MHPTDSAQAATASVKQATGGDLKASASEVSGRVMKHDDLGLAAEVAYHAMLAFLPFLLFLGAIAGLFSPLIEKDEIVDAIAGQAEEAGAEEATSTVKQMVEDILDNSSAQLAAVGLLVAVWSGSNAIAALMKGLDRIHGTEKRTGWLAIRAKAAAFLVLFVAVFVLAQVLIQGASLLGDEIGSVAGLPIEFIAWLLGLALVVASIGVFYRFAPSERRESDALVTLGSLVYAVAWIAITGVYTIYLSLFGGPTSAFGVVGAVILIMVWFFWTAFSVLLGAEVDRYVGDQVDGGRGGGRPPAKGATQR
ncbi:MAG: YihY family inner membrane protein [Dehalococcoidia bacterium]|nr:YihY family inner membrane protein [Dehalococcoidia bacterium]